MSLPRAISIPRDQPHLLEETLLKLDVLTNTNLNLSKRIKELESALKVISVSTQISHARHLADNALC